MINSSILVFRSRVHKLNAGLCSACSFHLYLSVVTSGGIAHLELHVSPPSGGAVMLHSSEFDLAEWTHIAATYDASTSMWTLYVNGQNAGAASSTTGKFTSHAAWGMGGVATAAGENLAVCDFRIWRCARSETLLRSTMHELTDIKVTSAPVQGYEAIRLIHKSLGGLPDIRCTVCVWEHVVLI